MTLRANCRAAREKSCGARVIRRRALNGSPGCQPARCRRRPRVMLEFRESLRALRRDRFYSLLTILTLALAIGATTAVFSIVNGVLLKPLPYDNPDALVAINEIWRQFSD